MKMLIIEPIPDNAGLIQRALQTIPQAETLSVSSWMASVPVIYDCWPDVVVADWAGENIDDQLKLRALRQMQVRGIPFFLWCEDVDAVPMELRRYSIGRDAGLQVLRQAIEVQATTAVRHA
jgi:hypothetical protein